VGGLAEHQLHDPLLLAGARLEAADRGAVAQHGGVVADGGDLGEAVRDEQHRAPAAAPLAHHREHALGEVGRQRRGDLVEQQQHGVEGQRARQVEHAQRRQRQLRDELGEVDLELHALEPAADRVGVGVGEAEVLEDGEVGDQRRVLEDGREAELAGAARAAHGHFLAPDRDAATVRVDHAGERLDQCGLAGAVGAEQRVDLALLDREVGVAQGDHRAVVLRDVLYFEQAHEDRDGRGGSRRRAQP
jgi:hypothetical protein